MSVIYPLDASDRSRDDTSSPDANVVELQLSTTGASPLHAAALHGGRRVPLLKAYLIAAAVTYLPMLLAALLGDNPVITRTDAVRLPFLRDWNVAFMFLVSFPSIIALLVS